MYPYYFLLNLFNILILSTSSSISPMKSLLEKFSFKKLTQDCITESGFVSPDLKIILVLLSIILN